MRERWWPLFAVALAACLVFAAGTLASPPQPAESAAPPAVPDRQAGAGGPPEKNAVSSTEADSADEAGTGAQPQTAEEVTNLVATHDPASPGYDADCLACHRAVLTTPSTDPRILSFHQAMLPFTPGYNPAHGPSNEVCVQCHRFVEIRTDSAGGLRKQVNPELCALCHGPSGPGPVYYAR